jgi:hypothetical protein
LSKRFIVLLAAAAAFAVIAAGCGSSSDDSSETVVVLTKTEFVKQGDTICQKGSKEIEDEANAFAEENGIDTSKPTKKEQEEVISGVLGPALQKQADEISALGVPDGEEEKVEAIVEALESGAEELEDDPASLLRDGQGSPLDEASELASKFGFQECGRP